jgi:hypothetical protein
MPDDVYVVAPTIIERWVIADKVEVASVALPQDGHRALLMFTDENQAPGGSRLVRALRLWLWTPTG